MGGRRQGAAEAHGEELTMTDWRERMSFGRAHWEALLVAAAQERRARAVAAPGRGQPGRLRSILLTLTARLAPAPRTTPLASPRRIEEVR
jgi:hypothetical protein